jgi:hypothetical protein
MHPALTCKECKSTKTEVIAMCIRNVSYGAFGGLVGGLFFGMMMAKMGALPMIGKMVGSPTAAAGFVAHMGISAAIGGSFGFLFGRFVNGLPSGLLHGVIYGGIWWILGPLTLMPFFMGMGFGVNWNAAAAAAMLPGLWGHLLFGFFLGATFGWLRQRAVARASLRTVHSTEAA